MITKAIFENFQSHKSTELNLSKGVNCIVGSSDVGKTALIRGLRWLAWNRPSGDAFRSHWGGDTRVSVELDGLVTVERVRDRENAYYLEGTKYSAVKTDVPDDVARVLNLNETNLQSQFDRPFLLDVSPGEVAAHFNRIARLDVIDKATKYVQSLIRTHEQEEANYKSQKEDLESQLKEYDDLDQLDQLVSQLETLDARRDDLITRRHRILSVISDLEEIDPELEEFMKLTECEEDIHILISLNENRKTQSSKVILLRSLITQITVAQSSITSAKREVVEAERDFDKAFPTVCPLCGKPK